MMEGDLLRYISTFNMNRKVKDILLGMKPGPIGLG